jgi:ATP-dependent DNA helicase RecG
MMTPAQLAKLVQGGESKTLESKLSTGELRSGMQALTALLNHRGGRVLFGVEPDGRVVGQHVSDQALRDIAAEVGQVEPPAFPAVERMPLGDGRWDADKSLGRSGAQVLGAD